jgi:L-seryl-tRNA(Ser) seleniumtransferase
MLALPPAAIEDRARHFVELLAGVSDFSGLTATTIAGQSAIGGGSGPNVHPATTLVALSHAELKPDEIERKLRACSPPVISRIADNLVLLDLRTVDVREEPELLAALRSLNS